MKITREIKTALLVVVCVIVFIFGYSFLKGSSFFKSQIVIHTNYTDVGGLSIGANVTINGLTVGKITNIDFGDDLSVIKVTMTVRDDLNFSNSSIAMLYEAGLIGGKSIAIIPKYDGRRLEDGDVLNSKVDPGFTELISHQIAPLQQKIESMFTGADSLFAGVNNVFNRNTQNNLKKGLEEFAKTIESINQLTISLRKTIDGNQRYLNRSFENIASTSENLNEITEKITQIELVSTVKEFKSVAEQLNEVVGKLKSKGGTLGLLVNDEALYNNLTRSSKALESLLTDLKEHPKRYVHFSLFGRKEKKSKPKE